MSSSGHFLGCHGAAALVQEVPREIPAKRSLLAQFKEVAQLWGIGTDARNVGVSCISEAVS